LTNYKKSINSVSGSYDPLLTTRWELRTEMAWDRPCIKCGSTSDIEMHHVRHLKDLNPKLSAADAIMAKLKRKQIPVCRSCHMKIHSGKL
jgi:hypothetical protein